MLDWLHIDMVVWHWRAFPGKLLPRGVGSNVYKTAVSVRVSVPLGLLAEIEWLRFGGSSGRATHSHRHRGTAALGYRPRMECMQFLQALCFLSLCFLHHKNNVLSVTLHAESNFILRIFGGSSRRALLWVVQMLALKTFAVADPWRHPDGKDSSDLFAQRNRKISR
jgi:hypothetical protein